MKDNINFTALELDKVLAMLADCCGCEDSRNIVLSIRPSGNYDTVVKLMNETSDAFMLCNSYDAPSLSGMKNVTSSVKRSQMGATLNLSELLDIERFLHALREMKEFRQNYAAEKHTCLDDLFDTLMPNKHLEERIGFTVVSEDEISDTASSELADIRRKIRNSQNRVKQHLDNLVHSQTYAKYLQEPIVTMRDGRYCVPVKTEYKTEIRGIVHDTSGTGSTVFIEPESVVEDNNETRVLLSKEKIEIQKILFDLSSEIASHADTFIEDYKSLIHLDVIFSKARLASKMNANIPQINKDGKIKLLKARHPLIDKNKIVPIDLSLGYDFDALVITGPNTGGKTVALKTLGLITLMVMCGLMIPAGEKSIISVFNNVFADIGDEQSIEQSLSTFSSHINNTIDILSHSDNRSLVLLDELGAGTDPVEGAALAISIIEKLMSKGTKVVATTHYAEMKIFALETDRVENACCEFDVESLSPTYKLLIGVPGKSNAFAITEKLGMEKEIVDRAKELVSSENSHFEEVVSQLQENKQILEKEREKAEKIRIETEKIKNDISIKKAEIEKIREKEIESAKADAKRIVEKVRRESQQMMDELSEAKKMAEADYSSDMIARARSKAKNGILKLEDIADPISNNKEKYVLPRKLVRGDLVEINGMSKEGTLCSLPDGSGYCQVQIGIVKTKVHVSELRLKERKNVNNAKKGHVTKSLQSNTTRRATNEIDLRGMDAEEGIMCLEKYIDECVMMKLSNVAIIHGKGTGKLRSAVQQSLKKNKAVKSFRLGLYGEGEDGVTIVELE